MLANRCTLFLWILALVIAFSFFFSPVSSCVFAANVTLAWDPNREINVAGYKIHYGTASRSYTNVVDAGKVVSYTLTGLKEGETYLFALTAYSTSGLSSGYSNEVRHLVSSTSGSSTIPLSTNEVIVNNGDPGATASGAWSISSGQNPYSGQSLFSKSASGSYTFKTAVSDQQQVHLWWTTYSNRSTSVPVKIYDGTALIDTVYVDQTQNGGKWYLLGSYNFSGSARVVIVSTSNTKTTCADAVRFVPDEEEPELIIDNDDPETRVVGKWLTSYGTNPFEGESLYSQTASNTFAFEANVSGLQEVSLWWTSYSNRSTSVPVKIYDGTTLVDTIYVDQTQNGGKWNLLGSYNFSGSARVVIVSTSNTKTTCADAVGFKEEGSSPT